MNILSSKRAPIVLALSIMLIGLLVVTLLYAQAVLAGGWSTFVVDTEGNVGMYTSVALDASGNPHISYYDKTSGDIKYAYIGKNGDNSWANPVIADPPIDHVANPNVNDEGMYTSIAIDHETGRRHISYYNQIKGDLWYAYKDGNNTWEKEPVDETDTVVGKYSSLALDDDGNPHISYYDETNKNLKYAYRDNNGWHKETIRPFNNDDSAGNNHVGQYTSIAVDSSSNSSSPVVYISYYDIGGTDDWANKNLKCAYRDANGTWWTETVDNTGDVGMYTSIALDSYGKPNISYYDASSDKKDLKFARKNVSGNWEIATVIMSVPDTNNNRIPDEELDYGKDVGQYSSLTTDISGNPHISYWNGTDKCLEYAYKDIGGWKKERVDPADLNTTYKVGEYSSIAINKSNNDVHISYYFSNTSGGDQDLKRAFKNNTPPTISSVDPEENTTTVEKDTVIKVTFSEPIVISNADAITLKKGGNNNVSASKYISSSLEQNVLEIKPNSNLESGTRYEVTIQAGSVTDGAGNVFASTYSFSFTVKDESPPTTTVNPSSNAWYSSVPNITLSASDVGSGVKNIYYKWSDQNSYTVYNGAFSAREGDYTLYYYAVDNLENTETPAKTQQFRVDTTKPTTEVNVSPSSPDGIRPDGYGEPRSWYKTTPTITLTTSDTGSGPSKIYYKWDNRSWIEVSGNTATVSMVINEEKIQGAGRTLYFRSKDAVGNEESERRLVFNIDDELPSITITVNPTQPGRDTGWYETTPTITLSASKPYNRNTPLTIRYKWDGPSETTKTASNGERITASQGNRKLTVEVTDIIGNKKVVEETFKVDTIPPAAPAFSSIDTITADNLNFIMVRGSTDSSQTIIRVKATDTLSNSTEEVLATVGSDRTFSARLNLISSEDGNILADGNITFTAYAIDQAGNISTKTTTNLKDTTPPVTSISVNPTAPNGINGWYKWATTRPTITLTADDTHTAGQNLRIYYKWGSAINYQQYSGPFEAPDCETTLFAYSIDRLDNTETAVKEQLFKVDTVLPDPPDFDTIDTITANNIEGFTVRGDSTETAVRVRAADIYGNTAVGTDTARDGRFSVTLNNLSDLRDGSITFTAYAIDRAGNESVVSKTIRKDSTPPVTRIEASPPDGTNDWYKTTAPSITITSNDTDSSIAAIYYKWNNEAAYTEITTTSVIQLNAREGTSTLTAYAIDRLGNTEITTLKQKEFKVDTAAPTSPLSISIRPLINGTFEVSWPSSTDNAPTGSGIDYYEATFNTQTIKTSGLTAYFVAPSADTYTISVRAYDKAGNPSSPRTITNPIDSTANVQAVADETVAIKAPGNTRPVTVSFRTVNTPGNLSITVSDTHDAGAPSGFRVRGKYFNITKTADTTGTITVCIPYDSAGLTETEEDALKLYHYNGSTWEELQGSVDKTRKVITGVTTSLSPFAVCESSTGSGGGSNNNNNTGDGSSNNNNTGGGSNNNNTGGGSNTSGGGTQGGGLGTPTTPTQPTVLAYRTQPIFSDVPSNAWYESSVSKLVSRGILGGYTDGTFKPNRAISKAEFIKLICYAMDWNLIIPAKQSFKDVPKNNWAYKFIETAKTHGIAKGYKDGTFKPNRGITRAEMARIIDDVLKLPKGKSNFKDIQSSWARDSINACAKAGIMKGYTDNTFRPGKTVTRAEASEIIARVLERK